MIKKIMTALAAVLMLTVAACGVREDEVPAAPGTQIERYGFMMGTRVSVRANVDESDRDWYAVLDEAIERVARYEEKFTVNDDDAESEVEKINRYAGIEPVAVSPETFALVEYGVYYSEISGGLFNGAIGPLVKLWNINFDGARRPELEEVEAVLHLLDYEGIILDEENQTVFLRDEGMRLDLGGIAKGFVADQITDFLVENGIENGIIDMGGDLFALGNGLTGNPWRIGIQDPNYSRSAGGRENVGVLPVTSQAVVTSGVYERFVEVDGVAYHHLLNSETGFPFETGLVSVSIVSDRAVDGEGLTKIVFGMGLEAGMEFIEAFDGAEAIFITRNNEIALSSGLKDVFTLASTNFTLLD